MPNLYRGLPGNISANLPAAVNIASSTNATPIVIQTSSAHGMTTGDEANVYNHQTNTAANGQWTVTVVDPTHFSLNTSTGNGVGGATGAVQPLTLPNFQQPSDGDPRNASSVDVPIDALADRAAFLQTVTGAYKLRGTLFAEHDDSFAGANNWTCVVSANNTVTQFTGTGLPQEVCGDAIGSDAIEVQLDTTLSWNGTTTNGIFIALYGATQQPGGSIGSYTRLLGSTRYILPASAGSTQFFPLTLRGYYNFAAGPIVQIVPAIYLPGSYALGTTHLIGDYIWTFKNWRVTGVPQ